MREEASIEGQSYAATGESKNKGGTRLMNERSVSLNKGSTQGNDNVHSLDLIIAYTGVPSFSLPLILVCHHRNFTQTVETGNTC